MSPSSKKFLPFPKKVWAGTKSRFQGAGTTACLDKEVVTGPPVGPTALLKKVPQGPRGETRGGPKDGRCWGQAYLLQSLGGETDSKALPTPLVGAGHWQSLTRRWHHRLVEERR